MTKKIRIAVVSPDSNIYFYTINSTEDDVIGIIGEEEYLKLRQECDENQKDLRPYIDNGARKIGAFDVARPSDEFVWDEHLAEFKKIQTDTIN